MAAVALAKGPKRRSTAAIVDGGRARSANGSDAAVTPSYMSWPTVYMPI